VIAELFNKNPLWFLFDSANTYRIYIIIRFIR
jgi:hypothetical protein